MAPAPTDSPSGGSTRPRSASPGHHGGPPGRGRRVQCAGHPLGAGGRAGPNRDIGVLNAAAALMVIGRVDDLAAGVELAADAIDSGRAKGALEHWWPPRRRPGPSPGLKRPSDCSLRRRPLRGRRGPPPRRRADPPGPQRGVALGVEGRRVRRAQGDGAAAEASPGHAGPVDAGRLHQALDQLVEGRDRHPEVFGQAAVPFGHHRADRTADCCGPRAAPPRAPGRTR